VLEKLIVAELLNIIFHLELNGIRVPALPGALHLELNDRPFVPHILY